MTEPSGRRTNRRGDATRQRMLEAARRALASGDPGAVSANHVAREAGVTWGAVKYQFRDADGLWAAVLAHLVEHRDRLDLASEPGAPLHDRVREIVDLLWQGLETSDARATDNLRTALPRGRAELERDYPATAAALARWEAGWRESCEHAFARLDVPPDRVREVAAFVPGAMRGLTSEQHLGTYTDLDRARRGLVNAIAAYLGE